MQKITILIITFFLFTSYTSAQKREWVAYIENNIHNFSEDLFLNDGTKFIQPDSVKLSLSEEIKEQFKELLVTHASFKYPFDSLKRIGIRRSKDKLVRTFTWSIKLESGEHLYYGFIQKKEGKHIKLFELHDDAKNIENLENVALTNAHWYGVNYYKIIDFKYNRKKYYALLGFRSNGYVSKTKVIEILSFTKKKVKFGKRVFKFNHKDDEEGLKRKQVRMVYEYNHNVSMSLNFDENYNMIMLDHLAPENSKLKDIRRFYGPDGSYDGFFFDGHKWMYYPDKWAVNNRNLKQEQLKSKRENKEFYKQK